MSTYDDHPLPQQESALELSESSGAPLTDRTDSTFKISVSETASALTRSSCETLQGRINTRSAPALAHDLRDITVDSTRWMLSQQGVLLSESRYLVHTKNLSRSFAPHIQRTPIVLDDSKFWIIGANWAVRNYWHWHAQILPAIIHARELVPVSGRDRIAIASNELTAWQISGLVANGIRPEQIVSFPREQLLHFGNVIYSDLLGGRSVFASNDAKHQMRDALVEFGAPERRRMQAELPGRVYISRGDTRRRKLNNERELEAALANRGFSIVSNSRLSLGEQIALYSNSDIVVAPHGAGSTNILFMNSGAHFIELQQASHVNAGPLSLGKISSPSAYVSVFPDDGLGQSTEGWEANIDETIELLGQLAHCSRY